MGGLLILVLGGLYIGIALYVSLAKIKPWWVKVVALAVFTLIPTADAVYGRMKLKEMCEKESGLKIFHVVDGVEGFYDALTGTSEDWVKKRGYRFTEGKMLSGKNGRVSLGIDGKIVIETGIEPKARYIYQYESDKHPKIYLRSRSWIRDVVTNEILSEFSNIQFTGGWVERSVAGLYAGRGDGGTCGPNVYGDELVRQTLRPAGQPEKQGDRNGK